MESIKLVLLIALCFVVSTLQAKEFELVVKNNSLAKMNSSDQGKSNNKILFEKIVIEAETLEEAIGIAKEKGVYESVSENIKVFTDAQPKFNNSLVSSQSANYYNDPFFSEQTYWEKINDGYYTAASNNILSAVKIEIPYAPIRVGVVDGGFYNDYEDIIAQGVSFINEPESGQNIGDNYISPDSDRECENGHGTAVMAVIGAKSNDGYGIAGIVDADLVAVRTLRCGTGNLYSVGQAIRYLIGQEVDEIPPLDKPVNVINLSLGGFSDYGCPEFIQSAINDAKELGVAIVAAAGNFQQDSHNFYPASCDGVISVAAISAETGDKFASSNFGDYVDIGAQGSFVASYALGTQQIGYWEETSFASPIVAGSIAMAYQSAPNLDSAKVEELMHLSVRTLSDKEDCFALGCGSGLLDTGAFVKSVIAHENNELGIITHALEGAEFCDKKVYLTSSGVKSRLCSSYKVNIKVGNVNKIDRATIYRVLKGYDFTIENAEIVAIVENSESILSDMDLGNYDYGYSLCEQCQAEDEIYIFNIDAAFTPSVCND
jgi:serine protease